MGVCLGAGRVDRGGSKSPNPLLTIQCVFKIVKVGTRRKLSVKEIMASVLSAMFGVTKAEK